MRLGITLWTLFGFNRTCTDRPALDYQEWSSLNSTLGALSSEDGPSTKTAAEFLTCRFPFSCLYNSCVSFLFSLKVYIELHKDWNDSYSNVHVLYKTPELRFLRSLSKDDGGKVARWLHSHVKWLYSVLKSIVLTFPSSLLKLSNKRISNLKSQAIFNVKPTWNCNEIKFMLFSSCMTCCFVLWCVMLCYVMLCYVMLCYVMLCYVMLCYVMLCYVMLCYVMLCYVVIIYCIVLLLRHVMLCYAMSSHVKLCCVVLISLT